MRMVPTFFKITGANPGPDLPHRIMKRCPLDEIAFCEGEERFRLAKIRQRYGIQASQFVPAARRPEEGDRVPDARDVGWRQPPGAAGIYRSGQDLHEAQGHRGAESPRADP